MLGTREPMLGIPGTLKSWSIERSIVAREGEMSNKDSSISLN